MKFVYVMVILNTYTSGLLMYRLNVNYVNETTKVIIWEAVI